MRGLLGRVRRAVGGVRRRLAGGAGAGRASGT